MDDEEGVAAPSAAGTMRLWCRRRGRQGQVAAAAARRAWRQGQGGAIGGGTEGAEAGRRRGACRWLLGGRVGGDEEEGVTALSVAGSIAVVLKLNAFKN